ncbi:DUF5107 domain-containing protein [Vibrio sp. 10N.261.51.F12]|uniref:DUF5107 domain-containing protein n=1 Tax=Vibrio sp. 10N.261.51.F12 TaxID=3229679 RepID=UPI00354CB632
MSGQVKAWSEEVIYPTYPLGKVDTNPMFLEKRVYQGSSGSVYPYGVVDSIGDEKQDKAYHAIYLENDFLKIMLLPELGGRIHRAYDKVKQRDFVYHNDVIKPALVGLVGPWISGGIEFNWPQHHRPTTFLPTDYRIEEHADGAVTVWMGEIEHMYGLKVSAGFKLYPNKSLIEITGKVYNPNDTPKQFLWWSNPAVKAGDDHQSIFPPDVTAVFDHGKRDVIDFPIATGEYYKVDYSPGTDISRYRNIPVPTSYMAASSEYDFVGAYSHDENGGLLHVANHHIAPGKKQWTWGNCDFGLAWDRNLTDDNGPYIELMTGIFTDNQPDFTWLDANEEKVFVQNFLPYSDIGMVKNANTELALTLQREGKSLSWGVYAIANLAAYKLTIRNTNEVLLETELNLNTGASLLETLACNSDSRLTITVASPDGLKTLQYIEHIDKQEPIPDPATAPQKPAEVASVDELYLIGQHLEQYHHATSSAWDYYNEALRRDKQDYRSNLALATLEYERANYDAALAYVDAALERAHRYNKNPICGKASYLRACIYEKQGQLEDAFTNFFKSTWSGNCKDTGFYALGRVANAQGNYLEALEYVERSLQLNGVSYNAVALKAVVLSNLGQSEQALAYIDEQISEHPLPYALYFQRYQLTQDAAHLKLYVDLLGARDSNAIYLANLYISFGHCKQAIEIIELSSVNGALPTLMLAGLIDDVARQDSLIAHAQTSFETNVIFPNTLTEIELLSNLPASAFVKHLLASFHYSKKSYQQAAALWREAIAVESNFAHAHRCLAIYAFNKCNDAQQALKHMRTAWELDQSDARVLFELDHLSKRAQVSIQTRLDLLLSHEVMVLKRDDLCCEFLALLNQTENHHKVAQIFEQRIFHPWEGGEGRVTGQFIAHKIHLAAACIDEQEFEQAIAYLQAALEYPENLGEGRLVGQTDNDIFFYLAHCYAGLSQTEMAKSHFEKAAAGDLEIGESKYYNDQPADYLFFKALAMVQSGRSEQATQVFNDMLVWGKEHISQKVERDFFAVSLPDLIVFDSDIEVTHRVHCLFVQYMGAVGLEILTNQSHSSEDLYAQINSLDCAHNKLDLIRSSQELIAEPVTA